MTHIGLETGTKRPSYGFGLNGASITEEFRRERAVGPSTAKHVLIVDDHAGVRAILRALLESHGYVCAEVPDGAAALALLSKARFDVVITDYQMPVMNGLQFLENLCVRRDGPAQPVILHTGSLDESLARRALDAGACRVLPKPTTPTELLATVAQALERR